jgi:hypothetical protein
MVRLFRLVRQSAEGDTGCGWELLAEWSVEVRFAIVLVRQYLNQQKPDSVKRARSNRSSLRLWAFLGRWEDFLDSLAKQRRQACPHESQRKLLSYSGRVFRCDDNQLRRGQLLCRTETGVRSLGGEIV